MSRSSARARRRPRSLMWVAVLVLLLGVAAGAVFSWQWPEAAARFRSAVLAAAGRILPGSLRGGAFVEGVLGEPAGLNPLIYQDPASQQVAALVFVGLTRVDGTGKVLPGLAESWEASAGGRLWSFRLRPNATWHDGRPVTPADVTFTINSLASVDFPGDLRGEWRGHSAWQVGDLGVVIQLPSAEPDFPIRASVPVLPRHLLSGVAFHTWYDLEFNRKPVGCGPYKFESWDSGREIRLTANQGYFLGAPKLETFVCRFYEEREAGGSPGESVRTGGREGLSAGEFSGTGGPSAAVISPAAAAQLAKRSNITLHRWAGPLFAALVPNHRLAVAEKPVRQAMDLVLDRAKLMSKMAEENGIGGQLWRSPEEQAGPYTLAGGPFIPGTAEAEHQRRDLKPDVAAARAALAAAGWADSDADGVLDRGAARLELSLAFPAGRPDLAAATAEIARQLGPVGIRVVPEELGLAGFLSAWGPPFDFDLMLVEWVNSPVPEIYDLFHSGRIPRAGLAGELRGGANIAGVSDTILDRILTELSSTPADASGAGARRSLHESLAGRLADTVPWVFLWRETGCYAAPKRLEGPAPGPFSLYWNVQDWTWR